MRRRERILQDLDQEIRDHIEIETPEPAVVNKEPTLLCNQMESSRTGVSRKKFSMYLFMRVRDVDATDREEQFFQ